MPWAGRAKKWSQQQVLQQRSGKKRRDFEQAYESLLLRPLDQKDCNVSAFVKHEKELKRNMRLKKIGDLAEDRAIDKKPNIPRMIQYRSTRYTATLAQSLAAVEAIIFKMDSIGVISPIERRMFAKGLNSFERAKRIRAMQKWGDDTVFLLMDQSGFDAHMDVPWLAVEHWIYSYMCGDDPELLWLLKQQIYNKGRSHNGIRYSVHGKKMSGEYNTSLGDSIVNACLIMAYLEGTIEPELFIDGDDSVVAISKHDWDWLQKERPCIEFFTKIGWAVKLDVTTDLRAVDFCQCRPMELAPGTWRMVRDPVRVLTRMTCSVRKYQRKAWLGYITSLGLAELACSSGVPILQEFADYLVRHGRGAKRIELPSWEEVRYRNEPFSRNPRKFRITHEARVSMALSWGISELQQKYWESYFSSVDDSRWVDALIKMKYVEIAKAPIEWHEAATMASYAEYQPEQLSVL